MSSDNTESSDKKHPFVDKFDWKQFATLITTHPIFRTLEESSKLGFNKKAPKLNEPVTNEYEKPMSGFESDEYRV